MKSEMILKYFEYKLNESLTEHKKSLKSLAKSEDINNFVLSIDLINNLIYEDFKKEFVELFNNKFDNIKTIEDIFTQSKKLNLIMDFKYRSENFIQIFKEIYLESMISKSIKISNLNTTLENFKVLRGVIWNDCEIIFKNCNFPRNEIGLDQMCINCIFGEKSPNEILSLNYSNKPNSILNCVFKSNIKGNVYSLIIFKNCDIKKIEISPLDTKNILSQLEILRRFIENNNFENLFIILGNENPKYINPNLITKEDLKTQLTLKNIKFSEISNLIKIEK